MGTPPSVVSVGFYDGVHLGHRHLIAVARAEAHAGEMACRVVTFDRHPAAVLHPEVAPRLLTAVDHKLELLGDLGVEGVHLVHFDQVRARESAEDFVTEVLIGELGAATVVVGTNFRFGFGRRGNLDYLHELGERVGFEAIGVDLVRDAGGEVVSSSRIRNLVAAGDLAPAAELLGRRHEVRGFVTAAPVSDAEPVGLAIDTELALPPDGRYPVAVRAGEFEIETTLVIADGLVELSAFRGASGGALHPGVRVACAFV